MQTQGVYCNIHQSLILNVCIDSACHNRGMICSLCARENHMKHAIIPLHELLDFLINDNQIQLTEDYLNQEQRRLQESIEQMYHQAQKIIEAYSSKTMKLYESLTQCVEKYKMVFCRQLRHQKSKIDRIIYQSDGCINSVSELLQDQKNFTLNQASYIQNVQFSILKNAQEQMNVYTEEVIKFTAKIQESFDIMEQHFEQTFSQKLPTIDTLEESYNSLQGCSEVKSERSHVLGQQRYYGTKAKDPQNYRYSEMNNSPKQFKSQNGIPASPTNGHSVVALNSEQRQMKNYASQFLLSPNNQSSKIKIQYKPANNQELRDALQDISNHQKIKTLWLDIPSEATKQELNEIILLLKSKKLLTKLFINFPKKYKIDSQTQYELFNSICDLTGLTILSFKFNKCFFDQKFNWEPLINTICFLKKKCLNKVLIVVDSVHKKDILTQISKSKESTELYDIIDFE